MCLPHQVRYHKHDAQLARAHTTTKHHPFPDHPPPATPLRPAHTDPKVVAFYQRLRREQLSALGLNPDDSKTIY